MGPFLQAYYLRLMQEIFAVLTDTMHKPGFRLQARYPRSAPFRALGFVLVDRLLVMPRFCDPV